MKHFITERTKYLHGTGMRLRDAKGKAKGDIKLSLSGKKRIRHQQAKKQLHRQLDS
jgi:hypothetical protein